MARLTRLEVESLSLERGPRTLFRDLSFDVDSGGAVALVGENGAGKTSLLRAIAGLLQPSEGQVHFLAGENNIDQRDAIRSQAHLIGHLDGLAGSRSARAEIEFTTAWTGGSLDVALESAGQLSLSRVLDLPVRKLSAGQRRRLAMVRLVATPRSLWLLDEPTTALDLASRAWMGAAMRAHLATGGLILAAAHDPLPIETRTIEVAR